MRLGIAALAAVLTACAQSPALAPSSPRAVSKPVVNPSNIERVGRELPSGYEVTSVTEVGAPPPFWGVGGNWTTDPAQCAAIADPLAGHGEAAQGVSGSGAGGIVYAVVAGYLSHRLDPVLLADCSRWTITSGRTRSDIRLIDPPQIEGSQTVGMASETTTFAEGGTRIGSHAATFTAYLGDYYAFTTLITDPGSSQPALTPQFAADLLAKTVAALRG